MASFLLKETFPSCCNHTSYRDGLITKFYVMIIVAKIIVIHDIIVII